MPSVRLYHAFSLACALLLPTIGCGAGPALYDVSGAVTYEGAPVEQATINFRGEDGKLYGGALQPDGTYEFQLPAGSYAVRIDAPAPLPAGWKEGDPLPSDRQRLVPLKFANFRSSNLTATVTPEGGAHEIDFHMP